MRGKKELNQQSVNLFPKHPIQTLHMDYRLTVMRGRVCPCCYDEPRVWAQLQKSVHGLICYFSKTQLLLFFIMEMKPFFELVKNSLVVKITHMVVVLLKDAHTSIFSAHSKVTAHSS